MQLGSFWGMTAPMMLMAFDGQYKELYDFLEVFNTPANRHLLDDVCLEFSALEAVVSSGTYSVADVDGVSSELSPFTVITDGCAEGKDDFFNQRLIAEFCNDFLKCVITADGRGKYYSIPKDLPGFVKGVLSGKSVRLKEVSKILRKALKSLPEETVSSLEQLAAKFHLTMKAPDVCCIGEKQVILSKEAKDIWKYFYDRSEVINTVIKECTGKAVSEDVTFGVAFFDMIKRRPLSLKYKVIEIFDRAKERQTAHLVPKCVKECAEELEKYRKCLCKYVDNPRYGTDDGESFIMVEDFQEILKASGPECEDFFNRLAKTERFDYHDYTKEYFQMLVEIWKKASQLNPDSVLGCSETPSVAEEAGIFGINYFGIELFEDSISCISLTNKSKIKKDDEDLDVIEGILDDVQALIDTLIPVGDLL